MECFVSGLPLLASNFRIEDDILYVSSLRGEQIVWSDRRLYVDSRYDTHTVCYEFRRKEYEGDPRPPQVCRVTSYHSSLNDALICASQEQRFVLETFEEEIPILVTER